MLKTCTFIGNFDIKVSDKILNKAKSIVVDLINNHNTAFFYCGGYSNFNYSMAKYLKELKQIYPFIQSIYIASYMDNNTFCNLTKSLYDDVIYPQFDISRYKNRTIKRNEWIINNVDYVIAFISHPFDDAYKTWKYVETKKHITKFLI